jgi:hypothetical protein
MGASSVSTPAGTGIDDDGALGYAGSHLQRQFVRLPQLA